VHVTATVYSHALPDDEIAAAQIWNKAMSGTLNQSPSKPLDATESSQIIPIHSAKKRA
jgi:hypothetical protein